MFCGICEASFIAGPFGALSNSLAALISGCVGCTGCGNCCGCASCCGCAGCCSCGSCGRCTGCAINIAPLAFGCPACIKTPPTPPFGAENVETK